MNNIDVRVAVTRTRDPELNGSLETNLSAIFTAILVENVMMYGPKWFARTDATRHALLVGLFHDAHKAVGLHVGNRAASIVINGSAFSIH